MNRRKLMLATGILAVIGAASAVAAVGERSKGGYGLWNDGHRGGHHRGLGLKRLDTDNDGAVSLAEFLKPREDRFAQRDANQDGVLDASELMAPMKERFDFRDKQTLRRLDRDKDGKISLDEFQQFPRERFAAHDLDDDGRLTSADMPPWRREAAERRERRAEKQAEAGKDAGRRQRREPATMERVLERAAKRFAARDANSDGFVDAQELATRHAERLAYATKRAMHTLDTDRDGKVSREEFTQRARVRFAHRDLDDNGRIDGDDLPSGLRERWKR